MINLAIAFAALPTQSALLTRPTSAVVGSDGVAAPRVFTTIGTYAANVQPAANDLVRKVETFADSKRITVFVQAELFTRDRLAINGELYEVEHVDQWSAVAGYSRALARALDSREPIS